MLLLLLPSLWYGTYTNSNYLQAILLADEGYDNTNDGHGNEYEKENETDEDGTGNRTRTRNGNRISTSSYYGKKGGIGSKGGKKGGSNGDNRGGKGGKKTGYTGDDRGGKGGTKTTTATASGNKRFGHFFMHIPKSGSTYALKTLSRLLFSSPEWKALSQQQQSFRPCHEMSKPLRQFQEKFHASYNQIPCTLWMSEQPFSPVPERVYAIVRDPRSHTLSMYFHCLESRAHRKKAHQMPKSLDTWLDAWIDAKNDTTKQLANQKLFACYNPLNFQTRWMGHNVLLEQQNNSANIYYPEEDGNNTATANTTGTQQRHNTRYMDSDHDLKERYLVLGDNAQMDKSVCMIFIHYTGWVPKRCDCSTARSTTAVKAAVAVNTTTDHRFAHGVTHHGSSFQTTPAQDAKIAILRDLDYPLYQTSRTIFREQVRRVEDQYNITLCDKLLEQ